MNRSKLATMAATVALLLGTGAVHAAAPQRLPACSWDAPGHNPFMGDVVAAIDHYADIPPDVRQRLQHRMAERRYDDLVNIRRDSIDGRYAYAPQIRDMHFGQRSVCAQTSRSQWSAQAQERGLVYCEAEHCILVPTVCRNVSRIERIASQRVAEADPPGAREAPLLFEPPAAGAPAEPAQSFTELAQRDVPTGVGEGMTPLAGPAAWDGGGGGAPSSPPAGVPPHFGDPFGGREPIGGLPPIVLPPNLTRDLPPPGDPFVPVTPVPEPQTWALMLGGLALVCAAARRQRRGAPN